jgi:hypothetical protein
MAFKRSGVRLPSAPLSVGPSGLGEAPGSGGGIGRRAGFRILWGQPREGSSPSSSITDTGLSRRACPLDAGDSTDTFVRNAHVLELVDRLV